MDQEVNQRIKRINTCEESKIFGSISRVVKIDEYVRSPAMMKIDLASGESRGYWISYPWKMVQADQGSGHNQQ